MNQKSLRLARTSRLVLSLALACLLLWTGGLAPLFAAPATAERAEQAPYVTVDDTAQPSAVNKLMLPVLNRNACGGTRDAGMPIGVQMYGNTGRSSHLFEALNNSGAHWLRVSVSWQTIEPQNANPRQYNWSSVDAGFAAARDACINIIAEVEGTPEWARLDPQRHEIRADMLPHFVEFVTALVQRYDGTGTNRIHVKNYEMYNEPDARGSWGNAGARYAAMLQAVYPAVKAANPQARVLMGGIAYDRFTTGPVGGIFIEAFMENVLKAGGGDYFDVMNFHCYPFINSCRSRAAGQSSGLIEKTAAIRELLAKYGLNKPIVITELGWHDYRDGVDTEEGWESNPEIQGRKLVQLLTQSKAVGAEAVIWWMLNSPLSFYPYDSGLVTGSNPPALKPAYHTYRTFIARVGWAVFQDTISSASAASNVEAYRFWNRTSDEVFYVAWLNPVYDLTTAPKPFEVTGAQVRVLNKEGVLVATVTDAEDGAVDGKVTVQVGGSPVYIVVD